MFLMKENPKYRLCFHVKNVNLFGASDGVEFSANFSPKLILK
jgi:hypothetical protein